MEDAGPSQPTGNMAGLTAAPKITGMLKQPTQQQQQPKQQQPKQQQPKQQQPKQQQPKQQQPEQQDGEEAEEEGGPPPLLEEEEEEEEEDADVVMTGVKPGPRDEGGVSEDDGADEEGLAKVRGGGEWPWLRLSDAGEDYRMIHVLQPAVKKWQAAGKPKGPGVGIEDEEAAVAAKAARDKAREEHPGGFEPKFPNLDTRSKKVDVRASTAAVPGSGQGL